LRPFFLREKTTELLILRASCKKPQEEQPQKGTKKHKKEKEEVNLFLYKEI